MSNSEGFQTHTEDNCYLEDNVPGFGQVLEDNTVWINYSGDPIIGKVYQQPGTSEAMKCLEKKMIGKHRYALWQILG